MVAVKAVFKARGAPKVALGVRGSLTSPKGASSGPIGPLAHGLLVVYVPADPRSVFCLFLTYVCSQCARARKVFQMTNAEKQARHRLYKKKAIKWYEKATGFSLRDVMDLCKLYDLQKESERER